MLDAASNIQLSQPFRKPSIAANNGKGQGLSADKMSSSKDSSSDRASSSGNSPKNVIPEWAKRGSEANGLYEFMLNNKLDKSLAAVGAAYQATKDDKYHLSHGAELDGEEMKTLKPYLDEKWLEIKKNMLNSTEDFSISVVDDYSKPQPRFNGVHFEKGYNKVHLDWHDASKGFTQGAMHYVIDKQRMVKKTDQAIDSAKGVIRDGREKVRDAIGSIRDKYLP